MTKRRMVNGVSENVGYFIINGHHIFGQKCDAVGGAGKLAGLVQSQPQRILLWEEEKTKSRGEGQI